MWLPSTDSTLTRASIAQSARHRSSGRVLTQVFLALLVVAVCVLPFADLKVYRVEPWHELGRMLHGLVTPRWYDGLGLVQAALRTVAFALLAVSGAAVAGLLLSVVFKYRLVRVGCASVRAIHELFWALLFMQVFGLSALTGVLAIFVPYVGIFAKVYAEILEQQSHIPAQTLVPGADRVSRYLYTWLPQAWRELQSYTRYRFECGLRSSAVLGFIGLPTLGFHLDTMFKQGDYSQSSALLLSFYLLILGIGWWMRPRLIPLYLVGAMIVLWPYSAIHGSDHLWRFLSHDIWPRALREGDWSGAAAWYVRQFSEVGAPALVNTLLISQLALALAGLLVLLTYPWASRALVGRGMSVLGHASLLILRSTPEIILAFLFLLLFGPSGLPAVLALAVHNGGLIAYLLACQSERLPRRLDAPSGFDAYLYDHTPRLFSRFLAFLLYRWENILRESAIIGILGVTTLGFYVDSAFAEFHYDRAVFFILLASTLNVLVDMLSRRLRGYAQLHEPRLAC